MTVSTATARAVVRNANTAGTQVTVTTAVENATGTHTMTGTARFTEPGNLICNSLLLFNVALTDRVAPCIAVRLTDLTDITPATTGADISLGTVVNGQGDVVSDDTWHFGAGTE